MSTEMKLTKKQKEIIALMKEGGIIKTHRHLDTGYWIKKSGYTERTISDKSFCGLLDANIIFCGETQEPAVLIYRLTELGKKIKLD